MAKIVLAVLVLGGAAFLIFSGGNKDDVKTEENTQESQSADEVNVESKDFEEKTTLSKLMGKGGNYMCTFVHSTQMGESTGSVYISNKKIRGDFVSKVSVPGLPNMGDITTHMISDGESVYTWSSMSAEGYKVPVAQEDKTAESSASVPTDQELDYKCVGWTVDQSKFSLPTNITFKAV